MDSGHIKLSTEFTEKDLRRFYKKVEKGDNCWIWIGALTDRGYGIFKYMDKLVRAHRFSYLIHFGEIPSGLLVCHTCDNPKCVNPNHFFLGTDQDNANDKMRKGRCRAGNGKAPAPHPSVGHYDRGCRCSGCREAMRIYKSDIRRGKRVVGRIFSNEPAIPYFNYRDTEKDYTIEISR